MLLSHKQNEIAKSNKRFRVVNAGRRFGKTILSIEEMLGCAVSKNGRRIAYIAPTFQQARDIAWEQLKSRCSTIALETNESQLKIVVRTVDGGKSTITLKSWDAIESLRGQSFHFLIIDEVAMMRNFWSGWQEVLRPALTDTKGQAMFISTPKGFNHFYDLYNIASTDSSWESFHATSYDNPHVDPKEIDEAKKQLTEDQFAQEYMADFRKQEGLVYKEFNRQTHLTDELPKDDMVQEYVGGIDFGYRHPAAVIHVKKDTRGIYWVTDEWYKTERTEEQIADYVKSVGFNAVYADPESPSAIAVLNRNGINVREVVKNKDSIINGIQLVRELFKSNRIKIHKGCVNLIAELESYRYPDPKDGLLKEVPLKENDHALDALRYVIMSNQVRPVDFSQRYRNYGERLRNIQNIAR